MSEFPVPAPPPPVDWPSLWKPFTGRDRTLLGVTAAFALVATANANVSDAESRRFAGLIRGARLARDDRELSELSNAFSALTSAMLSLPTQGRAQAVETLESFSGDPYRTEIILSAAQAAMVADSEMSKAETSALETVCQSLGVHPGRLTTRKSPGG
jgi:tellurite resistance protein